MQELLNKNEIKQVLRIPTTTLNHWLKNGMPIVKQEDETYFNLSLVQSWRKKIMEPVGDLEVGTAYNNQEISRVFKC